MSLAPASVLGMIHLVKILSLKRENQVKQGAAQSCLPVRNKSLGQPSLSSQAQESSSTKPTRGLHMTLPEQALGDDKMVVVMMGMMVVVVVVIVMVVMWWCGDGGDGGGDDDSGSDDNITFLQKCPKLPSAQHSLGAALSWQINGTRRPLNPSRSEGEGDGAFKGMNEI